VGLPPPDPASVRGQASSEYVALLALVAVVLAGAGAATGLDGVPVRVVHALRTALCIVGGDVCRAADARAAGLAPCVVGERETGGGVTLTIVSLRLGEAGEWAVAERSDGSVLVTRSEDARAGAGGGLGFELGSLEVGLSGSADFVVGGGAVWELPSAAAAGRFLADVRAGRDPGVRPTWRYGRVGDQLSGRIGVDALGFELTGVEATATAAAGARVGRGETTLYVDVGIDLFGPLDVLPGATPALRGTTTGPAGVRAAPVLVALTRDAGGLREIAFRRVEVHGSRIVETAGRLDLRDPANRAAAEPLLRRRLPWPPSVARDLRAVVRRTAQAGTVERATYVVSDRSRELGAALRLGVELGLESATVDVERRLVAASAWTRGSPERRREDCLPEGPGTARGDVA
jgi:hypothetical protein